VTLPDTRKTLDFIVIGAQKAGTTSLFEYLRRHPELCLPLDKEAPYFSHDQALTRGWDRYLEKAFGASDPRQKWGTITTHYMVGGVYDRSGTPHDVADRYTEYTVPLRIRTHLPDVRLIALLRNPVDRAVSHHQMLRMSGQEPLPFDQAVEALLLEESLEQSRRQPEERTGYVTWGEYGRILAAYFDVFPHDQLMVAFTDELESEPEPLMRRLHGFIGVSPNIVPDNLGTRYRERAAARRVSRLNPGALQSAAANNVAARIVWHELPPGARLRVERSFAHAAYRVNLWNQKKSRATPDRPSPDLLRRLAEHYEQDTVRLATMLGIERSAIPW
jgi:hypothetical protein